ncbi:MAG: response regulator, partial [Burkholderiales bacterium]
VESGDAALDALESNRFDVLVLDRNMPGMSGIDVARALRLTELGERRTPLIMLSADVTTEAKDEASQAGIDLFLPKPMQAGRLLEAIAQLCDRREADKTSRSPAPGVVESSKAVLNRETLALLEGLGTPQSDFMERLIRVFIQENAELVRLIQEAATEKRFSELRAHLHALKGSAASIGTDRLAEVSAQTHALQEAQLRTRGTAWANSIAEEFETARLALVEYLGRRDAKVRHRS